MSDMRESAPQEIEAVKALMREGHQTITGRMVEQWLAARRQAEDTALAERIQVEKGADDAGTTPCDPAKSGKDETVPCRGRKPVEPPWYPQAAAMVANGTPLRRALARLGIKLTERELKNIYRHVRFRYFLEKARVARWQDQFRHENLGGSEKTCF